MKIPEDLKPGDRLWYSKTECILRSTWSVCSRLRLTSRMTGPPRRRLRVHRLVRRIREHEAEPRRLIFQGEPLMKLPREVAFVCPSCEEPLDVYRMRDGSGYTIIDGRCEECRAYVTVNMQVDVSPNSANQQRETTPTTDGLPSAAPTMMEPT